MSTSKLNVYWITINLRGVQKTHLPVDWIGRFLRHDGLGWIGFD